MVYKRLIDASPFDKFIISIPDDVGDEYSYIRGVEDVLNLIRLAKTENETCHQKTETCKECKYFGIAVFKEEGFESEWCNYPNHGGAVTSLFSCENFERNTEKENLSK